MSRRQVLVKGGSLLTLPALLAACGVQLSPSPSSATASAGASAGSARLGKLTWSVNSPTRTLDPIFGENIVSLLNALGHESLLEFTPEGTVVEKLAESWEQVDLLTYVFQLRQGVTFWDGSPLTVDDVIFSINRYRDPANKSGWLTFWNALDTIEATGESEITMKLKTEDPAFKFWCAFGGARILSKAFVEQHPDDYGTAPELTLGTGPYKYTRYVPEETVVAVPNETYWGPPPKWDEIEVKTIVDEATRVLAFQSGEIDGGFNVPLTQTDQWESAGAEVIFAAGYAVTFLTMNTTLPPWNDIHVRKAIAHSVDYAGLVQAVLGGHGQVATAMTPPQQFVELLPENEVTALYSELGWKFDLDMARAELAQSAFPDGFQAEMTYADSQQPQGAVALNLSENLKQIGVDLAVREVPFLEALGEVFGPHPGGIYVVKWTAVSGDPAELPGLMFDSQYAREGAFNFTFYKNPEMDELLANQRTAADPATRARNLVGALRLANRDVFQVPVFYEDQAMGINNKFTFDGFSAWIRYFNWADRFGAR